MATAPAGRGPAAPAAEFAFPLAPAGDGSFPVLDAAGRPIARYRTQNWSRRFTAETADGRPLCSGRARRFLREYVVSDPSGATMLRIRTSFGSAMWAAHKRTVHVAGASLPLRARGQLFSEWAMTDPQGREAVVMRLADAKVAAANAGPLLVRVNDPAWRDLQRVVALVVGNRQVSAAIRLSDVG